MVIVAVLQAPGSIPAETTSPSHRRWPVGIALYWSAALIALLMYWHISWTLYWPGVLAKAEGVTSICCFSFQNRQLAHRLKSPGRPLEFLGDKHRLLLETALMAEEELVQGVARVFMDVVLCFLQ